jgi:hypothetical protein
MKKKKKKNRGRQAKTLTRTPGGRRAKRRKSKKTFRKKMAKRTRRRTFWGKTARGKKRTKKKRAAHRDFVQKPAYVLNTDFEFFDELKDLVLKSSPAEKDTMIARLNKIGRIKLAIVSGIFLNKENPDPLVTDLLIVSDDFERRKLRAFLKSTQAEVGKEIKFAVMDKEEFQYRLAMFDRFIRALLEGPHEKLINRLGI